MDVHQLQFEHRAWLNHNFPNQQSHDALLGIVEEVGELSHAHLKMSQGIRAANLQDVEDAVGDIFIYMMSYCNTNDIDLETCIENAWDNVRDRDWIKFPINGRDA